MAVQQTQEFIFTCNVKTKCILEIFYMNLTKLFTIATHSHNYSYIEEYDRIFLFKNNVLLSTKMNYCGCCFFVFWQLLSEVVHLKFIKIIKTRDILTKVTSVKVRVSMSKLNWKLFIFVLWIGSEWNWSSVLERDIIRKTVSAVTVQHKRY